MRFTFRHARNGMRKTARRAAPLLDADFLLRRYMLLLFFVPVEEQAIHIVRMSFVTTRAPKYLTRADRLTVDRRFDDVGVAQHRTSRSVLPTRGFYSIVLGTTYLFFDIRYTSYIFYFITKNSVLVAAALTDTRS